MGRENIHQDVWLCGLHNEVHLKTFPVAIKPYKHSPVLNEALNKLILQSRSDFAAKDGDMQIFNSAVDQWHAPRQGRLL